MVCGGVCQTPTYLSGKGKEACQKEFDRQIEIFLKNDVDFLLAEVCECVNIVCENLTSIFYKNNAGIRNLFCFSSSYNENGLIILLEHQAQYLT